MTELSPAALAERIWSRDDSLWSAGEDLPSDRLGWLDLPETMSSEIDRLDAFAGQAVADGFERVVLLGMGGSSLAPEMFSRVFGSAPGYPELHMLDSTHPEQVISTGAGLDLDTTLFLVSSKSGGTVETLSLYRHFRSLIDDGSKFVAITDPGSSLASLADERGFREVFVNPPDIGGRYSALSLFGLVPAALMGMDVGRVLEEAAAAAADARTPTSDAIALGLQLAAGVAEGRDKLTVVTSQSLLFFGYWVEQLLAESTGKAGTGIIPIVDEPVHEGGGRMWARLTLAGEERAAPAELDDDVELDDPYELAGQIFRWEFATAVAGAAMSVNPFDQPDVESAKRAARAALESGESAEWPDSDPEVFFEGLAAPEYAAILAFAPWTPAAWETIEQGRRKLASAHDVPTVGGFGPRYLHSSGQLYKGGPDTIRALLVLDEPLDGLPIPGSAETFDQLIAAQAAGDAQAMRQAGKNITQTSWRTFEAWATTG